MFEVIYGFFILGTILAIAVFARYWFEEDQTPASLIYFFRKRNTPCIKCIYHQDIRGNHYCYCRSFEFTRKINRAIFGEKAMQYPTEAWMQGYGNARRCEEERDHRKRCKPTTLEDITPKSKKKEDLNVD